MTKVTQHVTSDRELSKLPRCNEAKYPDTIVYRFSLVPNTLSGMDAILLQYKVLYMMDYFIGCSCFDKGTKIVVAVYLGINF